MSGNSSSPVNAYKVQDLSGNWTRIEMLLKLYDRAVVSITGAEEAMKNNDEADFSRNYVDAQKAYYENGPKTDWRSTHISAYASMHPWEDFAETFAAYLDQASVLDTASNA